MAEEQPRAYNDRRFWRKPPRRPPPIDAPLPDIPTGIRCPVCNCADFYVLHTLRKAQGIRRRRQCRHCGKVIRTLERLDDKKK